MESIDFGLTDLEPISLKISDDSRPSVNFGTGIELLMNDRKRSNSSSNINIELGELDKLEDELNELSGTSSSTSDTKTLSGFSNLFNFGSTKKENHSSNYESNDSKLGEATINSIGNTNTKTWDGYSKVNEVPVSNSYSNSYSNSSKMTDRDKRRNKLMMLKRLSDWYEKGLIKNSSHFNMDSNYDEIEDEYEMALEDKRKKVSIKLQAEWILTFVNTIEYGNAWLDPFDLNLDGWGEQVSENIDSYEEIFSELYDKWKGGKFSPEVALLLRLGFSAAVINITNKAFSKDTPGVNDSIKQAPNLMKMFTNATVKAMNQQDPRSGFMNNMMNAEPDVNTSFGPPPKAVDTRTQGSQQKPPINNMQFTQNPGNRPDISAGRGTMFREQGVDINNNQENLQRQERTPIQPPPQRPNPNTYQGPQHAPQQRSEMRGPQNMDINNILSGLKTKEVMIHEQSMNSVMEDNDSMISVTSLRDMNNTTLPKRTNHRKQRSDKNTISLDI